MTSWKPPQYVRPMALGLAWRDDQLLVFRVTDAAGRTKGVRPLGGQIDFLESAQGALVREFAEELGAAIEIDGPPMALENLYEFNGARGHELVFVYPIRFVDASFYAKDRLPIVDEGDPLPEAEWIDLAELGPGKIDLFPLGLLEAIRNSRNALPTSRPQPPASYLPQS